MIDTTPMSPTDGAPISVGMRLSINDRTSLRFDYAHGFEDAFDAATRDRVHIGLVTLLGPRP